ncbi:MAG: DUF3703 domain-containing protein [Saprospiraceae bacterium]
MKFNTRIPASLKPFYQLELSNYQSAYSKGNLTTAWQHLERAHILGQQYPFAHSFVHWKMLQFGIKIKSGKEIMGQIPRLIFGGIKSFVGNVPVGNPGGANFPPLKPFPIAKELQDIFLQANIKY